MKRKGYPEVGELVVGTARKVEHFGAFIVLDEYENKEGFIHISEVASGWVKYIRDYIREGQKIVCKVMGTDPSKGHIDLSYKRVNDHLKRERIQEWKNEQRAEKLFEFVAEKLGKSVEECYADFGLKLIETYGGLYFAFEEIIYNQKALEEAGFAGDWIDVFVGVAQDNISLQSVEIKGYIEITSPKGDGIEDIKAALNEISKYDTDNEDILGIDVQHMSAPNYRIHVKALDYKTAEIALKEASDRALAHIEKHDGFGRFSREEKELYEAHGE